MIGWLLWVFWENWPWFNDTKLYNRTIPDSKVHVAHLGPDSIYMSSYQYRKSHCGDKTVARSSYLHNGISYTGKTTYYIESGPWVLSSPGGPHVGPMNLATRDSIFLWIQYNNDLTCMVRSCHMPKRVSVRCYDRMGMCENYLNAS